MDTSRKIAPALLGTITSICVGVYSFHVIAARNYENSIYSDLYNRISNSKNLKICSGVSLEPSEEISELGNCFDEANFRFVYGREKQIGSWRVYRAGSPILVAEFKRRDANTAIDVSFFGDQGTVSDFKEKFLGEKAE